MFKPGTLPSRPVTAARLQALLNRFQMVMDLNMPGLELDSTEISGSAFYGCNFAHSRFTDGTIRGCTFELCFLPFSVIAGATFDDVKAKNCVFGGSRVENTLFRGSNLIQCNFNGVQASSLTFDDCDLLHTRFDTAVLRETRFENCNLKETRFLRTDATDITFLYANQEDAIFANEESW